jgi:outer membrane lipoprotein-sorting protein
MIPADKPGQKTIINTDAVEFNVEIPESFFSQQNMKQVK